METGISEQAGDWGMNPSVPGLFCFRWVVRDDVATEGMRVKGGCVPT
jgi:hypothetical protein